MRMKPSSADILVALGKVAAGDFIDPARTPMNWLCQLYDPGGALVGDGSGHTAAEAMAMAWVAAWVPDALIKGRVDGGEVPYNVPDGWRFELTPPWRSKPN
jgi:hypothetical protein